MAIGDKRFVVLVREEYHDDKKNKVRDRIVARAWCKDMTGMPLTLDAFVAKFRIAKKTKEEKIAAIKAKLAAQDAEKIALENKLKTLTTQ